MKMSGFNVLKVSFCVTIICLVMGVRSELTLHAVYSTLNDRLDSLALQTFSLKSTIETSIETMNARIDNIEASISQLDQHNKANSEHESTDSKEIDKIKFRVSKAFESEKKLIRRVLKDFGVNVAKPNAVLNGQMDLMKKYIDNSVKQFAVQFKMYEAEIDNLSIRTDDIEETIDRLKDEVHESIANLKGVPGNELTEMKDKAKIGFTASLSRALIYRNMSIIVFDEVVNNFGGGYSSSTGKFTAPMSGLYLFYLNVQSCNNMTSHILIAVNNKVVTTMLAANRTLSTGSNAAVEYMAAGDEAYAASATSEIFFCFNSHRTSFTGVLIS
ncbi:positive regulation of adiponectin secretion [Mactra antiquata]